MSHLLLKSTHLDKEYNFYFNSKLLLKKLSKKLVIIKNMNQDIQIGIFYGTTSQTTENIANSIENKLLNRFEIKKFNIYKNDLKEINNFEYILIGCPTWDIGLLQEDWRIAFPSIDTINFKGKKVAYFGAGDQFVYPDTFLDALGILEEKITNLGGRTFGMTKSHDYMFKSSKALRGQNFVGLGIDNDNEIEKTEKRIKEWCDQITKEILTPM